MAAVAASPRAIAKHDFLVSGREKNLSDFQGFPVCCGPDMQNPAWRKALSGCADPQRARHFLDQFKSTPAGPRLKTASPEQARVLTALFSGSQALSESLIAHPEWLASTLETELLQHPRQEQGLRREVNAWLEPLVRSGDCSTAFAKLRAFKQREMLLHRGPGPGPVGRRERDHPRDFQRGRSLPANRLPALQPATDRTPGKSRITRT